MKKINNTILFFLLLILFVIFLLYTFTSFKEGVEGERDTLYYTGYDYIYHISFNDNPSPYLYIDPAFNKVRYYTSSNSNEGGNPDNKRWRFYKAPNTTNKYYIKNIGTQKCLAYKVSSDDKTYLVGYKDPEELSTIIPNSHLWSLSVSIDQVTKRIVNITLHSNNNKLTRASNGYILSENKTDSKNITLTLISWPGK